MSIPSKLPSSKFPRLLPKKCESFVHGRINRLSSHAIHYRARLKHQHHLSGRQTSNVSFSSQGFQGIPSAYKVYKDRPPQKKYNTHKLISPYAINDDENDGEENGSISTNYPKGKKFHRRIGIQQRNVEHGTYFLSTRDSSSSLWSDTDQEDTVRSKDVSYQNRSGNHGITLNIMKKIQRLDNLQNELEHLMKRYGEKMGVDIMNMDEKAFKSLEGTNTIHLQDNLLETEETYRKICIVLRQLIAGWSWMKPIPRYYAEKWQSDQERNPLPPTNAAKYLNVLESIRKQRDDLICICTQGQEKNISQLLHDDQSEKSSTKLVKWLKDKFSMTNEVNHDSMEHDASQLSTQLQIGDLSTHKSIDYTANVRLYDTVINCFYQWRHISVDVKGNSIESIFSAMKDNYQGGNPNVKPDIKTYHRMMQYYKDSETLVHSMKAVELLKEMIKSSERSTNNDLDVSKSGRDLNVESCKPTIATFALVVSAFHGIGSSAEVKVQALDAADEVLNIMETFYSSNDAISNTQFSKDPSLLIDTMHLAKEGYRSQEFCEPYRAMLQNLLAVGPKLLSDYKLRVDNLVERLIGKQSYEKLVFDDDSLIDRMIVDHLFLHDLIHALAITNEKSHINKAKVILKKMEAIRDAASEPSANTRMSAKSWPLNYPMPNSYKSIILGILHSSIDVDDESPVRKVASVEDAVYATELLNTILTTKPSLRNVYSCYRVIRLWGATNSEDAGRKGEEILGKMILGILINKDQHSVTDLLLRAKQSTLENWSIAAAAGSPGAASNAFNLMERMRERLIEENINDDRRSKEMAYFYIAVIRACAETVLEQEKEQALDIAFETYNKMIEDDVTLTPFLFVQLMKCCQLASSSSHDKAIRLSKEVFQAACMNGLVNRHVLFVLKQVNYHLFESYEKKPEHSANVKKISHLDD